MTKLLFLTSAFIFLFFSACSSATETAFFSLSPLKLKAYQRSRSPRKRQIGKLLSSSKDLLVTIFILNAAGNILLQNSLSALFGPETPFFFKVIAPFCLILLFGEIIPKYMGLNFNDKLAEKITPYLSIVYKWLAPIRKAVIYIIHPISRFFSLFFSKSGPVTEAQIAHMIDTAKENGAVDSFEHQLILNHYMLQKKSARELMLPKEDLPLFSNQSDPTQLNTIFQEIDFDYIAIADPDIDHIAGLLTDQQWLFYSSSIEREPRTLMNRLRPVLHIQESTPAALVLEKMQAQQLQLAVVVNEYGSTSGFIDYNELTQQLINRQETITLSSDYYRLINPKIMVARGKLPLESFNQYFTSQLESDNYTTLAGWLIEQIQAIPVTGQYYETEQFLFHVLKASPKRVHQVYIRYKGDRQL